MIQWGGQRAKVDRISIREVGSLVVVVAEDILVVVAEDILVEAVEGSLGLIEVGGHNFVVHSLVVAAEDILVEAAAVVAAGRKDFVEDFGSNRAAWAFGSRLVDEALVEFVEVVDRSLGSSEVDDHSLVFVVRDILVEVVVHSLVVAEDSLVVVVVVVVEEVEFDIVVVVVVVVVVEEDSLVVEGEDLVEEEGLVGEEDQRGQQQLA